MNVRKIVFAMIFMAFVVSCSNNESWENLIDNSDKLQKQGKYEDSTVLLNKALDIAKNNYGKDHHNFIITLDRLAMIYALQRDWSSAEYYFKQELSILEKKQGTDHPAVASLLGSVALIYEKQGKYNESEMTLKRELAIWEKTLGPNNLTVLNKLKNLSKLYIKTNKINEARMLEIRIESIHKHVQR